MGIPTLIIFYPKYAPTVNVLSKDIETFLFFSNEYFNFIQLKNNNVLYIA